MAATTLRTRGELAAAALELVDDGGRNQFVVVCSQCKSKILLAKVGTWVPDRHELPQPALRKPRTEAPAEIELEVTEGFWKVDDMFHFENVGYSHTQGTVKFLCCADCEIGPLGLQFLDRTPPSSYVAASRVRYHVPAAPAPTT